ncbi:hypothetical protein [Streptosporangium subroseum]|uniref:hypothetical protein n=1 Tax=Streptosporangium subroseum TaxID=106412 RepID=UPI0030926ABE|nr:hypothetical protein OHB15_50240 [Streptosporangium subroseum]
MVDDAFIGLADLQVIVYAIAVVVSLMIDGAFAGVVIGGGALPVAAFFIWFRPRGKQA